MKEDRGGGCWDADGGGAVEETGHGLRRAPARTFEALLVWQKAHAWVLDLYSYTKTFPREELYGLTSQFRGAAISIPANIAEGFKKRTVADKKRFMKIAQGSLKECRYYLILSRDLQFGENSLLTENIFRISRLLNAYSKAIEISGFRLLTPDS